jgi:hypothetical protein
VFPAIRDDVCAPEGKAAAGHVSAHFRAQSPCNAPRGVARTPGARMITVVYVLFNDSNGSNRLKFNTID